MFSQSKTNKSTSGCLGNIQKATDLIKQADRILVGIGAGMSAAGGLDYANPKLAERWYPEYYKMGLTTIIDIMANYWPNTVSRQPERFWGFWAKHIFHIRYEPQATKPYLDLFKIIADKEHFIVTTNVDGQLEKAGFKKEEIFAPQGDYAFFQCAKHCCDEVYDNRHIIETMIRNMPNALEIRTADIPKCLHCGAYLMPNLRCDENFAEAPHMGNRADYEDFINLHQNENLIFLELGVGFNTPGIIRIPFEQMTKALPNATLVRINTTDVRMATDVGGKAVCIASDVSAVLEEIYANTRL